MHIDGPQIASVYGAKGYVSPLRVLDTAEAEDYRRRLEAAIHDASDLAPGLLKMKSHLVFGCLDELVRHPRIVDTVATAIGPDILCWTSSMFIKEPRTPDYVSWHQDITYWGLDPPDVITAWVALTPSTPENGCMKVVPGTHRLDVLAHRDTYAANNMLSRGQEVAVDVNESEAADIVLQPGEMSLHHAKIVHGSHANGSDVKRMGFAIRYMPTSVRQSAGAVDSAMLVRGEDRFHHFLSDPRPNGDFDPNALPAHQAVCERARQYLFRKVES